MQTLRSKSPQKIAVVHSFPSLMTCYKGSEQVGIFFPQPKDPGVLYETDYASNQIVRMGLEDSGIRIPTIDERNRANHLGCIKP